MFRQGYTYSEHANSDTLSHPSEDENRSGNLSENCKRKRIFSMQEGPIVEYTEQQGVRLSRGKVPQGLTG